MTQPETKRCDSTGPRREPRQTVLVTGGAGYIGSHTCKRLYQLGFLPVTFDNLSYGHEHAVKWGPLEIGDLLDRDRLEQVFDKHEPVAVIHFAAYSLVGESVENPARYFRNNVVGSLNLIDCMVSRGVMNLVFSSTCATYGVPANLPIVETTPQCPVNPYGQSKLMIERMLADYDRAYHMRSISLRYFNACGADRDGEIGEEHEPETHLIPRVLMSLTGELPKLTIFGTDYDTPDGTCVRDYIHVEDLASAHILALRHLLNGGATDAFNLGTGDGFSVRQIIDSVERVTGLKVPRDYGERRPGDPPLLLADISKIRRELGWTPECSDIDAVIRSAWQFHSTKSSVPVS